MDSIKMICQHHQDIGQENQDRSQWSVPEPAGSRAPGCKGRKEKRSGKVSAFYGQGSGNSQVVQHPADDWGKAAPDQMGSHA